MADNKLQSLTEIFNEKFFRIPDFQRGYSWQLNQLDDFWEDINNLKEDRVHYTGTLTVEPIEKSQIENNEKWQDDLWLIDKGMKAYYLVDGQQRLTTSIILINEILSLFPENEGLMFQHQSEWRSKFLYKSYGSNYKSYVFGYEKDNPSDEYFKTKILSQESFTADKCPEQTLYTTNLKDAKDYFDKKLKSLSKDELEVIFKKVTTKFKYNFYEIDSELDVYVTFETMNNRGKKLSHLELLKNRLIYMSTLFDISEQEKSRLRSDINETWKTIYEFLGKNKDKPMDDDDFLKNHWIMYFHFDKTESNAYAKFLLNEKFTAKKVVEEKIKISDIQQYIKSLQKSIKSWFHLHNPQFSEYNDTTKEWLEKLNRLGMGAFPPILMASLTKYDEQEFLPLLKTIEKFIFLVFKVTQRQSNTQSNHINRLASKFHFEKDNLTIDKLIEDIDFLIEGELGTFGEEDYQYHGWFDFNR